MKKLSEIRSFISDVFEKYQQTTFPEKMPNEHGSGQKCHGRDKSTYLDLERTK